MSHDVSCFGKPLIHLELKGVRVTIFLLRELRSLQRLVSFKGLEQVNSNLISFNQEVLSLGLFMSLGFR